MATHRYPCIAIAVASSRSLLPVTPIAAWSLSSSIPAHDKIQLSSYAFTSPNHYTCETPSDQCEKFKHGYSDSLVNGSSFKAYSFSRGSQSSASASSVLGLRYLSSSSRTNTQKVKIVDDDENDDVIGTNSNGRENFSSNSPSQRTTNYSETVTSAKQQFGSEGPAKERIFKNLDDARERGMKALYGEKRSAPEILYDTVVSISTSLQYVAVSFGKMLMYTPKQWSEYFSGVWKFVKHEAHHYWVGTKLLAIDLRIASGLGLKAMRGNTLTRRERRQLTRTTSDIFRLVPFSIFVLVPFMEFLLPFALRLFPNMLPSTFENKVKKEEEMKKKLQAKIVLAKFLQETFFEMASDLKDSRSGEVRASAQNLFDFMSRVRAGESVSQKEMLSHAKLFNDEITLDSLNREQLNGMSYILGLSSTTGLYSDDMLRIQIREQLRKLKSDDMLIREEGIDSLNDDELRAACRSRGIRALYGSTGPERMRKGLEEWLDLSLKQNLPSSLLVLTRAIRLTESILTKEKTEEEYIQQTLASLPPIGVNFDLEGGAEEKEKELEYILQQQQLIEDEEKQRLVIEQKEKEQRQRILEGEELRVEKERIVSNEMDAKLRLENQRELEEIAQALSVLASTSAVSNERAELMGLVQKEIDAYNSRSSPDPGSQLMFDVKGGSGYVEEVKETKDNGPEMALSSRVDRMLSALNDELNLVEEKIGQNIHILDSDDDGRVTPEEISKALDILKKKDDRVIREAIFGSLNLDTEGTIQIDTFLESLRSKRGSAKEQEN